MEEKLRIMVVDVAAESGGALTILSDFYHEYKDEKSNEYIFVVSRPILEETNNIRVLRYPWIKKSWLHRIYFDYLIAPTLVRKFNVDEVLSLQNVIVPNVKVRQLLYMHQPLPFIPKQFSLLAEPLFWVYQNIIG